VEFDILQEQVKGLAQLLHNMADIDNMVDELNDAAKKAGDRDAKAHRQAWASSHRSCLPLRCNSNN
jgi:uncharacterized protein YoxC